MAIHQKTFQQSQQSVRNEYLIDFSDYKFFFGDLNFRIDGTFKEIYSSLSTNSTMPQKEVESWIEKVFA